MTQNTSTPGSPAPRRRRKVGCFVLVLLLILGGGGYGAYWYFNPDATPIDLATLDGQIDRTYTLKKGDLVLGLTLPGTVTASAKHQLSLQANVSTKLVDIIDENTWVKKGDVLATFESEAISEKIKDLQLTIDNTEKELVVAVEDGKVQESTNEANVRAAENRLALAEQAMRKYLRYERRETRDNLELKIKNAEEALDKAYRDYLSIRRTPPAHESAKSESERRNLQEQDILSAKNKYHSAQNSLVSAETSRKVNKRYDHPNKMLQLLNECEQAELNLRKAKVNFESNAIQRERSLENLRSRLKRNREELGKQEEYLKQMQLTAPADGIVIYGGDGGRRGSASDIKLGMDIWRGMVLLTIPEMSNLIVEFDLPELYRSRVKIGDKVIITPDSLPNLKLNGAVETIATLPVPLIFWDQSSPKVFKSRITLERQDEALVNGMSVRIEIVTKVLSDTLFVPIEAVFEDKDRFFVYQKTATGYRETDISIGDSNDAYVQVTSNLGEGDTVLLYRPYQKK